MRQFRLALRTVLKTPSVTILGIVSLALGIGATAAIFSLFHQMLLKPLPVKEPSRLVNLGAPGPKPGSQSCNDAGDCDVVFSYRMFRDLERDQQVFTGIAAHRLFGANLAFEKQTMSGQGMLVSGSYFPTLGIIPALGRLLGPQDDPNIGQSPVVVLSHSYWQNRFLARTDVLNQTLIVNGHALTIVGVAPEGFDGTTLGSRAQVFVPITLRGLMQPGFDAFENRLNYWVYVFARLKPGMSLEQAKQSINLQYHTIINDVEVPLQRNMSEATMARFKSKEIALEDGRRGQSSLHKDSKAPLLLLLGVTGFVLLIACANIANLLLARGAARSGEMAVRLSIGANRRQLVLQLLLEACVLAMLGGIAGLAVARWTLDLIASLLPPEATTSLQFSLDPTVVLFAAVLTLSTGILFGLFPALQATKPDVLSALKGQSGQPSGARSAARFRSTLATVQIALSLMLLVSAGLFVRSLINISRVDLGLNTDHLITFSISPELNAYPPGRSLDLFKRLEDELKGQPGVKAVTASSVPIIAGSSWGNDVSVQGFVAGPDTDSNSRYNKVGPRYFEAMGIPLIAGREFTDSDVAGAPKVAIVNQQFARKFNLGNDVVGKRMKTGGSGAPDADLDVVIVGLVRNAKYNQVKQEVPPLFFLPYRQDDRIGSLNFYVRTSLDPESFMPGVQSTVARLDPNLPVEDLRTMEQQIEQNIAADRIISVLSAAFASLATILAAVGLYGVLAYTVAQRTREIGLRMALGAQPSRVRMMIVRQVAWMTGIGAVAGLAAAIGIGQLAQSQLFGLKGNDPAVLIVATVLLVLVALAAAVIPARRASRIDPIRALRYE